MYIYPILSEVFLLQKIMEIVLCKMYSESNCIRYAFLNSETCSKHQNYTL